MYPFFKIWYCICFPRCWFLPQACTEDKTFRELSSASGKPGKCMSLTLALCVAGRKVAGTLLRAFLRGKGKGQSHWTCLFSQWWVYLQRELGWPHPVPWIFLLWHKKQDQVTFLKADYRTWTHQRFSQLSICQLCNSLSLAQKEIFSWEKIHP